ncbi:MAG: hypothetical protein J5614_08730 [Paludibacteraceae bacterium]|nr:hypothetical protein [Paludibacteraceae bacterium]
MTEERCESKFEICFRDISKDDAWMLTYITVHMLKDPSCIRDIYQMLTGDDNNTEIVEDVDPAIDFILLDSLGRGYHASSILRYEGVNTERELIKFVYTRGIEDLHFDHRVFGLGPSILADIAVYMNIRNIIPKGSDMSDVISHFMNGSKARETLRLANVKYKNYMEGL